MHSQELITAPESEESMSDTMTADIDWKEMNRAQKKVTRAAVQKMFYQSDDDYRLLESLIEIGESIITEDYRDIEEMEELRENAKRLYDKMRDLFFESWRDETFLIKMNAVKERLRNVSGELLKKIKKDLHEQAELVYEDFKYYEKALWLSFVSSYMNTNAPKDEFPSYSHCWIPTDTRVRTRSSSEDLDLCRRVLSDYYCFIREHVDRFADHDEMCRTLLSWVSLKAIQAKNHLDSSFMDMVPDVMEEISESGTGQELEADLFDTNYTIADSSMYLNKLPDYLEYLDKSYFEQPGYEGLINAVNSCLEIANRNLKRYPADEGWMRRKANVLFLRAQSMYRILYFADKAHEDVLSEAAGSYLEAGRIYQQMEALEENKQKKKLIKMDTAFCGGFINCIRKKHGNDFPVRYPDPDSCVFNVVAA